MPPMTRLQFSKTPGTLNQYARALMATGRTSGDLNMPQSEAIQTTVNMDKKQIAAYAKVCGFPENDHVLPLTYPHLLAFPLHMELMLQPSFPLALIGLIHIRNTITRFRDIHINEKPDIRCFISDSEQTNKGLAFDITTEISVTGELVWQSVSTNLAREKKAAKTKENKAQPVLPDFDMTERWLLTSDLGRRYARISGDSNPIHLHAMSARLFGFKRHIAHGMWSKARTAARLQQTLGASACTITTDFKLPVYLPNTIELNYTMENGNGATFDLRDINGKKVHMKGSLQIL